MTAADMTRARARRAAASGSTEAEIASQPDCWRRAAALAPDLAHLLPAPGERVAVVGCGTSWFIAQSFAAARESAGQGETDAFAASEMPPGRRYDRVLVLSRSGTTTEILRLLARLSGVTPNVLITADPATPVASAADAVIGLDFADERSVVQTRFATTELALLLAHLGEDIAPMAAAADRVLAADLPAELLAAAAVHVPRHRLDVRPGQRGGAEAAGSGRALDRGLPGDGVPARADRRDRAGQRRLAAQPGPRRTHRRDRGGRRAGLAVAGSAAGRARPRAPRRGRDGAGAAALTRTSRATSPAPSSCSPASAVIARRRPQPGPGRDPSRRRRRLGGREPARARCARWPGGKGLNVARTLHALGADVLLLGVAGGPTGAAVRAGLQAAGVPAVFTEIAADTRRTFVSRRHPRRRRGVLLRTRPRR